jgi:hypothetical protein
MNNRFRFDPEPETASVHTFLVPSALVVYPSRAVEGAVTLCMATEDGYTQAGTRLTREQASDLARALVQILGAEDDDPHTLAYDIGHAAGYKAGEAEGFNAGWDQGHDEGNSDGWDDGYELGYERGYEAGSEEVA